MSDDVRRKILERRAAFVAAAFASISACERTETTSVSPVSSEMSKGADASISVDASIGPAVCLSESPQPCLAPPPLPTTDARPIACLSPPRPKPRPCLEMAPGEG